MAEPVSKEAFPRSGFEASVGLFSAITLIGTLLLPVRPFLVWNASPSSTVGLYEIVPGPGSLPGQTVVAWPPPAARRLAANRKYLPAKVPLVKGVAAVSGAVVCASGKAIFVNGRLAALRRSHDPSGRPMPWWSGCERLGKGDVFLLSTDSAAFDGRYFGVTRAGEIVGRAKLVWRP